MENWHFGPGFVVIEIRVLASVRLIIRTRRRFRRRFHGVFSPVGLVGVNFFLNRKNEFGAGAASKNRKIIP